MLTAMVRNIGERANLVERIRDIDNRVDRLIQRNVEMGLGTEVGNILNEITDQDLEGAVQRQVRTIKGTEDSIWRVVDIGVTYQHKLADRNNPCGSSSLFNLKLGNYQLPIAPTFMIKLKGSLESKPPPHPGSSNPKVVLGPRVASAQD